MISTKLVPSFERGEIVVVIDEDGAEQYRGPLLGIIQKRYSTLEFAIGTQKINIYCGWATKLFVLNAEKFDEHLREQNTRLYSDVADKFVSYASKSFTEEERDRVDNLINELTGIARLAAEREYHQREQQGASPESYQGIWGNHDLDRAKIERKIRKDLVFGLKLNYSRVYDELHSLEQDDSVICIRSKQPVKQSSLKNGTEGENS